MIELSVAQKLIASLDDRSLRAAVPAAIFDGRHVGGLAVRDAQPEDIFIPILATPEAQRRQVVLAGCRDVCGRFFTALGELAAGCNHGEADLPEAAEHFSALLSAARPHELHAQVRGLLEAALDSAVDAAVRDPLVGLAVSYASIDPRPEFWQDLLNGDIIPGHAFQALRRIDPRHPRLEGFLSLLWRRALQNEISLRLPFIVDSWAKQQASPQEAVRRVLVATLLGASELRDALLTDCARYPHSKPWADLFPTTFAVSVTKIGAVSPKRRKLSASDATIVVSEGIADWQWMLKAIAPTEVIRGLVPQEFCKVENLQIIRSHKVITGLPEYMFHSLLIGHAGGEETGKFVKLSLDRVGANLLNQMQLMQHPQLHERRA